MEVVEERDSIGLNFAFLGWRLAAGLSASTLQRCAAPRSPQPFYDRPDRLADRKHALTRSNSTWHAPRSKFPSLCPRTTQSAYACISCGHVCFISWKAFVIRLGGGMLWLLSLLNDAMLLAATVPLAETLDAVADAKREEIAAAPERAAGLGMVRWPLGRLLLSRKQKMER